MADINNVQPYVLEDISIKCMENSEKLNKHEYISVFKDTTLFPRDNFPNDFDIWSVEKQYDWINQNLTKFFNIPQSLINFIPAAWCQLNDDRSPEEIPDWMDMDKFHRGQKFVQKHYTAILLSKLIGTLYSYTFNEELKSIIIGGHRHTLYSAFKKYLSIIKRMLNWYNGEPWIKGTNAYKDMQVTRKMHLMLRKKLCNMNNEEIDTACEFAKPWCPDRELLLKDFTAACPSEELKQRPYAICNKSLYKQKSINNSNVAGVQGSFIVLPVLYPQNIGIHNTTDEDLEAFCHMWRCFGYFLGLEDEYNFCRGTLPEIKQRLQDFHQYWTIPNFKYITSEWEHVTRCLIEQFNYYPLIYMPYKTMILIATEILNLPMPHLYTSLNYAEWLAYISYKFVLRHAMKFSIIRTVINIVVHRIINKVLNFDSEKLAKLQVESKKKLPEFYTSY